MSFDDSLLTPGQLVTTLDEEYGQREEQGNAVGQDQGEVVLHNAIDKPAHDPEVEHQVHDQGDFVGFAGSQGEQGLREKGERRQCGGQQPDIFHGDVCLLRMRR